MSANTLDYSQAIHEAAMDWHALMVSGFATDQEKAAFQSWLQSDPCHADAYDQAITVWQALGNLDRSQIEPALLPASPSWMRRAMTQLSRVPLIKKPRFTVLITSALVIWGAAAISLPIVRSADPVLTEVVVLSSHKTDVAVTKEISLEDGSVITLGAATEVEIAMSSSERRVTLKQGDVLFNVTGNLERPFFVEANDFEARVVGTVFDVRHNGGVVRLSVAEGGVEVSHPLMINNEPSSMTARKSLQPGEQVFALPGRGLAPISNFAKDDFAAWRDDRLKYRGATLVEIIADANRYSERPIIIDESLESVRLDPVSMAFNGRDTHQMLRTLPRLFKVHVRDDGEGPIVISAR